MGLKNISRRVLHRSCHQRGFTFIEVLLVVSILSVITVALYNTFSNGFRIWDRSRKVVIAEDTMIFFDKLSRELRNAFDYSELKFKGDESRMRFTTLVRTKADPASNFHPGEYINQVGQVDYYYDYGKKSIFRRQANYGQALEEKFEDGKPVVTSVNKIRFRYYYDLASGYGFRPEGRDDLPIGILVEVEFKEGNGARTMTKFVRIPSVSKNET